MIFNFTHGHIGYDVIRYITYGFPFVINSNYRCLYFVPLPKYSRWSMNELAT